MQNIPTGTTGGTLTVGTTYYYVITAKLGNGTQSVMSNQEFYTPAGSNTTAQLSWAAVPNATGYDVYRSTVSGSFSSPALVATVAPGTGTITFGDTGIAASAGSPPVSTPPGIANTTGSLAANTYFYLVTAITPAGETIASNEQPITTTTGGEAIALSWAPVSGATGYLVYRSTTSGSYSNRLIGITAATTTTFLDTGVNDSFSRPCQQRSP